MPGSYTITDLATIAGGLLFIVIFIGYISHKAYNLGFYRHAPRPYVSDNSKEYTLRQVAISSIIIGVLVLILAMVSLIYCYFCQNIALIAFSMGALIVTGFIEVVFFLSSYIGEHHRSNLGNSKYPIIEINIENQYTKLVKDIYASDDTFLYCIINDSEWSMIRKDKVLSVEGRDKKVEKSTKSYSLNKLLHWNKKSKKKQSNK